MEKNGEVQLFPRTAMEIQYTLIVLAVLACVLCADRVRALAVTVMRLAESRRITVARLRPVQFGAMGTLLALLLIGGMGASYMTDQYMPAPKSRGTMGYLALRAQQLREPDGTCPDHAGSSCITPHELKPVPTQATTPLACRNLYQRFDPPATQP
jgi:galactan 5-O-arabinofuranosyltransferase